MRKRRSGLAIPLVGGFCVLTTILIFATVVARTGTKRINKVSFEAMKAHYMAQGAIQLALLKFRVLPLEARLASVNGDLPSFFGDLNTATFPHATLPAGNWTAAIIDAEAMTAMNQDAGSQLDDWTHVVKITAEAEVSGTGFRNSAGVEDTRIERIDKIVEIVKERDEG